MAEVLYVLSLLSHVELALPPKSGQGLTLPWLARLHEVYLVDLWPQRGDTGTACEFGLAHDEVTFMLEQVYDSS